MLIFTDSGGSYRGGTGRSLGKYGAGHGFALVVALGLMGFVTLLLVGLAGLAEVENRRARGELEQFAARANALYGLRVGLAELQRAAGPDTRVTARADILTLDGDLLAAGSRHWTGVWDTNGTEQPAHWLVSGLAEGATPFSGLSGAGGQVELVADGTSTSTVLAGLVDLLEADGAGAGSRFAWWIGDEGIKAKVNTLGDESDGEEVDTLSLLTTARRFGVESMAGYTPLSELLFGEDAELELGSLSRITNPRQIELLGEDFGDAGQEHFFDITTASFGVLSDVRDGGLRRDLTARLAGDGDLNYPMWRQRLDDRDCDGPNWNLVREFARLVEATANAETRINGVPVLPVQQSRSMGIPNYMSPQIYPQRPHLSPLLVFGGMTYAIFAVPEAPDSVEVVNEFGASQTFTSVSYRLRLAMKPVVALWNPYDVAIESDEGYVLFFQSRNGGMHQFGPRINVKNTSTDIPGVPVPWLVQPPGLNRNVPIGALLPGAPRATRPERQVSTAFNIRDYNPRFTIDSLTLLPGELAWFSLPPGTDDEFDFTEPGPDDSLYGMPEHLALGGPVLTRGHNPEAYVWAEIHSSPLGSSWSSATVHWQGTFADLGRVDFWYNESGELVNYQRPVRLLRNVVEVEEQTNGLYPIHLRFAVNNAGGQFGADFFKGRVVIRGDNPQQTTGYRNKNLQTFWSSHAPTVGVEFELNSPEELEAQLMTGEPVHFSSWGIVLSTPGWEHPRQVLAHYTPRATVHHNFLGSNFGMGMTTWGPTYRTEAEGGLAIPAIFDPSRIFPQDALRRVETESEDEGSITRFVGPILYHVPDSELVSIGQLAHLELSRNCWAPNYVVGNSFASPWLSPGETLTMVNSPTPFVFADQSYHTNEALWDGYFFSTWNETRPVPLNPRLRLMDNIPAASDEVDDPELRAAAAMLIDGPFNINSTSVEAWKAVLSSLNQTELPFADIAESPNQTLSTLDSPFPRWSRLSLFGGEGSGGQLEFETWRSIPELTAEQVDTLATRIVHEIRLRGRPFTSLASFVNREPGRENPAEIPSRDPQLSGILQRALDGDYSTATGDIIPDPTPINPTGTSLDWIGSGDLAAAINVRFPEAFTGLRATGVPGYLTQADILQALGPILTARSDTFVIRAYGDSSGQLNANPAAGPTAQAWCEAIVQRLPEYIDPTLDPTLPPTADTPAAEFGRRFRIVSFRWLSNDEI